MGLNMVNKKLQGASWVAFSVAMLSERSYRGKLAHWTKCLHLGVGQVASECTSGLNGLLGLPAAGSKQSFNSSGS